MGVLISRVFCEDQYSFSRQLEAQSMETGWERIRTVLLALVVGDVVSGGVVAVMLRFEARVWVPRYWVEARG